MNLPKIITGILMFWAMQVVAMLLFKWGSNTPGRWAWGFFGGHLFGVSSMVFLMSLFKMLNPNVAMGICLGGAFLMSQIALAVVYRPELSLLQYAGILTITIGISMLSFGGSVRITVEICTP